MESIVKQPIVLIFGKICSGKSTYAEALSYLTKAKRVTVSDVVKRLSGLSTRSGLQSTDHLDQNIGVELVQQIKTHGRVIIDGIRQVSIVNWILREVNPEDVLMIWLEVPDNVRQYRFYDRVTSKDDLTFEEADARDEKLGLLTLQDTLKNHYIVVNN